MLVAFPVSFRQLFPKIRTYNLFATNNTSNKFNLTKQCYCLADDMGVGVGKKKEDRQKLLDNIEKSDPSDYPFSELEIQEKTSGNVLAYSF